MAASRRLPDGTPHKKTGPKPAELTPTFIFGCGKIMCTQEEIGDLCGLSQPQVSARLKDDPELAEAFRRGQATAKQSLRRVQFKNAHVIGLRRGAGCSTGSNRR